MPSSCSLILAILSKFEKNNYFYSYKKCHVYKFPKILGTLSSIDDLLPLISLKILYLLEHVTQRPN